MISVPPLSLDKICEYLTISRDTFLNWITMKEMPSEICLPNGDRYRFRKPPKEARQQLRFGYGQSGPGSLDRRESDTKCSQVVQ